MAKEELQRLEVERMEELAGMVKAQYPGETELLAAIDRCRILEPLDTREAIEEFSKCVTFITREIRRLKQI